MIFAKEVCNMKNFVFISPNFPTNYWMFCKELVNNGMRVLGIGDAPYDELTQELKNSLHEYYKVSNLENDEEVFRAVAFFTFKYGKIDWLESNNEYWLRRDAHLRTEFHITTGPQEADMDKIKLKSAMKAYYAKAGIPTARYILVQGWEDGKAFIDKVGYPVVVKPDNGVGANNTYRLECDADFQHFLDVRDENIYIMEELVRGHVTTYDAILDSKGQAIYEASNVTPNNLIDVVNLRRECPFYIRKEVLPEVRAAGLKTIKAFDVKRRFVHLEFFVLDQDQEGLGKRGEVIGLEVNMRPSGGYTPDMYNFAHETNVYKIWADMVAFDCSTIPCGNRHYAAFIGRRNEKNYVMNLPEVQAKYGWRLKLHEYQAPAIAKLMGDEVFLVIVDTEEELQQYYKEMLETK